MVWEGNNGSVTRKEIKSALGMLSRTQAVLQNGIGNVLSDGVFGQAAYGAGWPAGLAFGRSKGAGFCGEICGQHPRDPEQPGERDNHVDGRARVWPTGPAPPFNKTIAQYAGSENGDIWATSLTQPFIFSSPRACGASFPNRTLD